MRILIAEDDRISLAMLSAILEKAGFETVHAGDGLRALEIMLAPGAPDLAVIDWEMPGMDGPEVCRRIRERRTPNPPYLIILTARGGKGDVVRGLDAGANDYIAKPFDTSELQARIRVGRRMVELQGELVEARDALAHEAMHDPLTGILNRRAIMEGLDRELKRALRRGAALSVGLLDIDHFKEVNDSHGHQAGDEVLRCFARTVRGNLRSYDLVGRYGGEEFLVVAPDSTGFPEEGLYERLRLQVTASPTAVSGMEIGITVSIGVAWTGDHDTVDTLLAAADRALYQAKGEGRNRVVCPHTPEVSEGVW
jgi:diguanylate cyclase (GGDEF)-like protein